MKTNFKNKLSVILIILTFSSLASAGEKMASKKDGVKPMDIRLESSAFKDTGMIPVKYSCDGDNFSPPLSWNNLPAGAKTLALICDDPDAPAGIWVHWVIFNIPAALKGLPENVPKQRVLADGSKQGIGSGGDIGYDGPCPPGGTHRYFFKIYAVDTELKLEPGINKNQLLKSMEGHILAQGQLMGKYSRK